MTNREVLDEALERAYRAFAEVPRPTVLEGVPSRHPEELLRLLSSAPLRQLPDEPLAAYAFWAMTTVGEARDYLHFLPRVLELTVRGSNGSGTQPEIIASKSRLAAWNDWPEAQRDAVLRVFAAAFACALDVHPDHAAEAPSWLCGLARLGAPMEPLLLAWERAPSVNALLQLADFVHLTVDAGSADDGLVSGFWDEAGPARTRVSQWLHGRETRERLRSGLHRVGPDEAWRLEAALRALG